MECININLLNFQNHPAYRIITKIMLVLSDLQKSDIGLMSAIKPEMSVLEKRAILMYYIKAQISILDQSLELYDTLKKENLTHFRELKDEFFTPKEDEDIIDKLISDNWKLYIKDIRDKMGHHYDDSIIQFSRKEDFIERNKFVKITRGHTGHDWKFNLAEKITEDYILECAPNKYDIFMTRNEIINHINVIRDSFLNYYGDIVWVFFRKLSASENSSSSINVKD